MTSPALHPEDLIDRVGSLSAAEQAHLDAHLSQCAACRFELRVRGDFVAELGTEAPAHDGLLVAKAIERAANASAVDRALAKIAPSVEPALPAEALRTEPAPVVHEGALPVALEGTAPARRRRARRAASAVLVAASFLLATASFAAAGGSFSSLLQKVGLLGEVEVEGTATDNVEKRGKVEKGGRSGVAPAASPIVATAAPTLGDIAPHLLPEPLAPAVEPEATPKPAATSVTSAATLFTEASEARRSGDHRAAGLRYRELIDRFPGSMEANAACVALGRLLLDQNDPAAAVPLFDRYLALGRGPLREEATAFRAKALGQLGRWADERTAWRALLAEEPGSIYAERARQRLEELGAR